MISKVCIAISLVFCISTSLAQTDDGKKINTQLIKVTTQIYSLQGNGGNIGVFLGEKEILLIDSGQPGNIEQIQNDIKRISSKPIRTLINTSFEEEHTGGNSELAKAGIQIYAHENTRKRLILESEKEEGKISKDNFPNISFPDNLKLHYNDEEIHVFHIPEAHTDGDALVYFTKSKVLHTGDVFIKDRYPLIDIKNGGSTVGYIKGLNKTLSLIDKNTKIIPGHGTVGNYHDLEMLTEMMNTVFNSVTREYELNKSEEDVVNMSDIIQKYEALNYGNGTVSGEIFLRNIYRDIAKNNPKDTSRIQKNLEAKTEYDKIKKMHGSSEEE